MIAIAPINNMIIGPGGEIMSMNDLLKMDIDNTSGQKRGLPSSFYDARSDLLRPSKTGILQGPIPMNKRSWAQQTFAGPFSPAMLCHEAWN